MPTELTPKPCGGCGAAVLSASLKVIGSVVQLDPDPTRDGCWVIDEHGVTRHRRRSDEDHGEPRHGAHNCPTPVVADAVVGVA
ncbi:MAG: hypothetical protein QOJ92_266 [Frankiales bacterium]|nr:hypothetical protein [Frankiales bacterium]